MTRYVMLKLGSCTVVAGLGFRSLHLGCSQRTATSAYAYYISLDSLLTPHHEVCNVF